MGSRDLLIHAYCQRSQYSSCPICCIIPVLDLVGEEEQTGPHRTASRCQLKSSPRCPSSNDSGCSVMIAVGSEGRRRGRYAMLSRRVRWFGMAQEASPAAAHSL